MNASFGSPRWARLSTLAAVVLMLTAAAAPSRSAAIAPGAVDVRMVTDEADAVLAILAKRRAHEPVAEADWRRLFTSEGYLRLQRREEGVRFLVGN
jgi:hypothetical protein